MASKAISNRLPMFTLALALTGLGACKDKGDDEASSGAGKESSGKQSAGNVEPGVSGDTGGAEPTPTPEQEPDDPRATALTIARAAAASAVSGEGVKSLGFRLDKISHLFSLAATAKIPDWGEVGQGEAKLARDDDLDTAWQCEFGKTKPCVLGLALPEPAKVEALRMYVAAGPRYRDYTGHPRVAKVRVHTQIGYVDAALPDGASHVYVRFDAPIETQHLAIEVLETHAGKTDALVQLAEIEVYGTDGVPRQPIDLDPDYAWVSWETTTWSETAGDHTIRQVFLNFARPHAGAPGTLPSSRRLLRATAVFGQVGDDYLLFERLHGTDCDTVRGSYVLFDKRNRMFYALGDLGGAGAQIYRHAGGRGFAVGWMGAGVFTIKGVVEEAGELEWRRPPKLAPESGEAKLREWGFETTPMARAQPLTGAIPGCHRAAPGELDPLITTAKFEAARVEDPSNWIVCSVGEDTLYAAATCGMPARAYQLSGTKLVGKYGGGLEARGLRLRRVGDRVMLELSAKGGDTSTLIWAEPGQFIELGDAAGLFVRPPSTCSECDDAWTNPALALDELDELEEGEPWANEGSEDGEFADEGNDESLFDEGEDGEQLEAAPPPSPSLPPG
jgi:hypothetical protein